MLYLVIRNNDVSIIDFKPAVHQADLDIPSAVLPGDAITDAVKTDQPFPGYAADLEPVPVKDRFIRKHPEIFLCKSMKRDQARRAVWFRIDLPAPVQRLAVKILDVPEIPPGEEVVLYVLDQTFDFSFCLRLARTADFRNKSNLRGEGLELVVPYGSSVFPAYDDVLHVVRHDFFRNAVIK